MEALEAEVDSLRWERADLQMLVRDLEDQRDRSWCVVTDRVGSSA